MVGAVRAVGDEVVAVVSGDLQRAKDFAAQHGIPHALSDEKAYPALGVDAVYISNTNEKHEASALFAAAQGCHVLCEKPLATSLDAAIRMVRACRDAGVVMGTNHHLRHNGPHRAMREHLRAGTLGKLVAARMQHSVYLPAHLQGWRLDNPTAGGGVVLDIVVHNADSLAFLLGEYPVEVCAMVSNSGMAQGLEDNAMSVWRFASGITASSHQGFNTPYAATGLELHGTRASLHGNGMMSQQPSGDLVLSSERGSEVLQVERANLYEVCLQEMHRAIRGEAHEMADGVAGAKSLAVALAVLESARTGRQAAVADVDALLA
jgi:1,5-anhydro-D-fructose reductase (1,5-anhydro-D-mannitol-forming)